MRTNVLMTIACLAMATGCSVNGAAEAFVKENDATVAEVTKAATAADARKAFDSHKDALATAFGPLKEARGFQISQENSAAMMNSLTKGASGICMMQISAIGDPTASATYKSICDDYSKTFGM
jgi:hypothetical protein